MQPIIIKTAAALDITLGQLLNRLLPTIQAEIILESKTELDDYEDEIEIETFTFETPRAIEFFLLEALQFIAHSLATSTGDDAYFDYTPSLLEQYSQLLRGLKNAINLLDPAEYKDKDLTNWYSAKIAAPRMLTISIEFYNTMLIHQAPAEIPGGPNHYFEHIGLTRI